MEHSLPREDLIASCIEVMKARRKYNAGHADYLRNEATRIVDEWIIPIIAGVT